MHLQEDRTQKSIVYVILIFSSMKNLMTYFLYVTLEPCTHYGKTPPCCDLILESGLTNIIVGQVDPNPKVAGNSIKKLEAAEEMLL